MRTAWPRFWWVLALMVGATPAVAQDSDSTNNQVSVGYEYRRRVKEHLRGFGDIKYQEVRDPDRLFGAQNQLSTTGGAVYDLSERLRIEGGLGLYYNYSPDATDTFETRFWQSATVDWPNSLGVVRRYVLSHRFRLEERFKNISDWSFSLRFRYRLSFSIAINRYTVEPGAFFVPLRIEFYAPLGSDVDQFLAQRARYTVGLGYVIDKGWTVELRYAQQQSRATVGTDLETTDHFLEFRLKSSFRIADLLKGR